jgi:hypothetical protein
MESNLKATQEFNDGIWRFLMKKFLLILVVGIGVSACAKPTIPPTDLRIGTNQSPYRTMPTYIECGDCSFAPR